MFRRKVPKLKKGAWYYHVSGSYLPATWQGWMMHLLLLACGVLVLVIACYDKRSLIIVFPTAILELVGIGALFTWFASRNA